MQMHFLSFLFLIFISVYLVPLSLLLGKSAEILEQDRERYKKISERDITNLLNQYKDNSEEIVSQLKQKLDSFYLSDPSAKKIMGRQKINYEVSDVDRSEIRNLNKNMRRLLIRDMKTKEIDGFFIKEAFPLFLLHREMGKALLKLSNPQKYQAAFHFRQSLRYRSLELSSSIFTDEDRLYLLDENDPQILSAENLKRSTDLKKAKEKEIKELKDRNIILIDSLGRNNIEQPESIKEQIKINQEKIQANEQEMQKLNDDFSKAEESYNEFKMTWDSESSDFLVEMANLMREIEDELNESQEVKKDFKSYTNLLQIASRLTPMDPELTFLLAQEYRRLNDKPKAIDLYESSLKANEDTIRHEKLSSQKIEMIYSHLGGLYHDQKKFVDSAFYYAKSIELNPEPEKIFQLGVLHSKRTGNFRESFQLLQQYAQMTEYRSDLEPGEKSAFLKRRFYTMMYMAQSQEKLNLLNDMLQSLVQAKESHIELKKIIKEHKDELDVTFKELQKAKIPLLEITLQAELNVFHDLENKYTQQRALLSDLESVENSLPLKNIYFKLGDHFASINDIENAIAVYKEAEIQGIYPDEARRKIVRLSRLLSVGNIE